MKRTLLIAVALATISAQAASLPDAPGLLPTVIARPILLQDPGVAAARAGLDAARQEAGILESSPHEWNIKLSSQQRSVQGGARNQEWNAGIERPLRLPGKAAADKKLGSATIDEAEAHYGEVIHETARELFNLWLDWLAAEQEYMLAARHLQSAQDNLAIVEKRLRAGDVAKLDVNFVQAELAEQRRIANDAKTQATSAWERLQARFPGISRQFDLMPTPLPIHKGLTYWRERIMAESDELKIIQAHLLKAQAHSERARADRLPDPTFGIYTASEVGGRERITGVTLTIPIPGEKSSLRATKTVHLAEAARQEVELKMRQLNASIASAFANANGSYVSFQIAEAGANAMQNNDKLIQRAYALGEAELQALLIARRQATSAAQNALAARVAATRSYYLLLIDGHFVWGMDQE